MSSLLTYRLIKLVMFTTRLAPPPLRKPICKNTCYFVVAERAFISLSPVVADVCERRIELTQV